MCRTGVNIGTVSQWKVKIINEALQKFAMLWTIYITCSIIQNKELVNAGYEN